MSSTRGVDIAVPYYFNIAPNYDYTFTPRVMTKRGVMLGNEGRFKYDNFETQVNFDYLPDDRVYDDSRWGTRIQAAYNREKLAFRADYNRVSDDDYVTDFSGSVRESSEAILPQDYSLSWTDTYWNSTLRVTKNQALEIEGVTTIVPYERVPQVVFNGYAADWRGFELTTMVDATKFSHPSRIGGTRLVASQGVSYPFRGAGWFVIPKAEFMGAWYQLDNMSRDGYYRNKTPSRFTPTLTLLSDARAPDLLRLYALPQSGRHSGLRLHRHGPLLRHTLHAEPLFGLRPRLAGQSAHCRRLDAIHRQGQRPRTFPCERGPAPVLLRPGRALHSGSKAR